MIAIVTDSTAYLTHEEAVALGVVVVPMSYSFSDNQSFNEGCIEADTRAEQEVAEHIDTVHTSQASLNGFINTFKRLKSAGYEILCLTISSRLSGTYANAVLAAKEVGKQHIEIVDSLTTCSGLYLLIREARMRIRAGAKLSAVAKEMQKLRERVRICFSVDDMAPLRRSGRLDQANKLCAFCKDAKGLLVVDNFLGAEAAEKLPVKLAREDLEIERRRIGPVLGAHLGRGCVGVAYIAEDPGKGKK